MERVHGNYLNYTLSGVLGCLLAFLPLISNKFNELDGVIPIFLTSIASAFILIYWLCCRGFKGAKVSVNIVDISFILYICYGFLRIDNDKAIFNPIIVREWFGLVIIYALVRVLESKFLKVLYHSLFTGGTIQAIIGIFQYANLLESNNLTFKVTGSFFNPGHYGGFLALSFIAGIFIWREKKFSASKDCFLHAKRMTPNHISPVYGLWLVNQAKGNKEECIRLSKEIITMPVRVINNVVLKARKDARDYIQKQEK